jgi:hypothetical protein
MALTTHLPRHRLEALSGGHDPDARAHLVACTACADRLEQLEAARATFLARRDPMKFAREVTARPQPRRPISRARWVGAAALAAVAALALLMVRGAPESIRYKGGSDLHAFVERDGRPRALTNGEPLRAGDRLAFTYAAREPRHLLLLSIDEAGAITRYYPEDEGDAPLPPAARAQLPVGIELDSHRGEERLVALFSLEPLDEAQVRQDLREALRESRVRDGGVAGMQRLDIAAEQASVWFRKP